MQQRRRLGQPLQGLNTQLGIQNSATADNADASQRQQNWNIAAAQQYQQMRQGQQQQTSGIDVTQINNETNRIALAKALGYNPKNSPAFGQMYAKFLALPKSVQVGIYKQGGAPFLDDEEDSGVKSIQDVAKKIDDHKDEFAVEAAKAYAANHIGYDKLDANGNPDFWQQVTVPNANPMLPPTEQRQPLNPVSRVYLQHAINSGIMPDPVTGKFASEAPMAAPQKQMSTDEFQQILNARQGTPDTQDNFQNVLNSRAGIPPNTNLVDNNTQSNMSLTPYNYGSNMSLSPYSYQNNLQFGNSIPSVAQRQIPSDANDPFVRAHNAVVNSLPTGQNFSDTLSNIGDIINDTAQGVNAALYNTPARILNAGARLLGGSGGGSLGQIPLPVQNVNAQPPIDPAVLAAIRARQQPIQDADTMANELNLGY